MRLRNGRRNIKTGVISNSTGHFQRRRRPCRHSDEPAAEPSPRPSRFLLHISPPLSSTIERKNQLRVTGFFAGLERRSLTASPLKHAVRVRSEEHTSELQS